MTRIQLFYSRAYPGNTLRANTLQALAHLGVNPEMQVEETVPEQTGTPLPALAIDGEIVVYGVEPSVHELELLLQDRVQEREADLRPDRIFGGWRMERNGSFCDAAMIT